MALSILSSTGLLIKTAAGPGIAHSFTLESRCMFVGALARAVAPIQPVSRQGPLEQVEMAPSGVH